MMNANQIKWFYLFVLSLIWGSSFILIKKGLVGLTALQLGSLRIIFAALFLIFIGFKSLQKIRREQWKYLAITSLFGTFLPAYLFAIAETEIDSATTGILNSLTPLITLLLGVLTFGILVQKRQVLGVFIGLLGSGLIVYSGFVNHPEQNYFYAFLVLIACFCYALNVNLIKKYLSDLNSLSITAGNFAILIVPASLILLSTDFTEVVNSSEVRYSMLFILILGVLGTGIANIIFFKLIQISSPVFATSVTYLIPIVACLWGFLDGELLSPFQLIGAFVVLIGVYLSAKK